MASVYYRTNTSILYWQVYLDPLSKLYHHLICADINSQVIVFIDLVVPPNLKPFKVYYIVVYVSNSSMECIASFCTNQIYLVYLNVFSDMEFAKISDWYFKPKGWNLEIKKSSPYLIVSQFFLNDAESWHNLYLDICIFNHNCLYDVKFSLIYNYLIASKVYCLSF